MIKHVAICFVLIFCCQWGSAWGNSSDHLAHGQGPRGMLKEHAKSALTLREREHSTRYQADPCGLICLKTRVFAA